MVGRRLWRHIVASLRWGYFIGAERVVARFGEQVNRWCGQCRCADAVRFLTHVDGFTKTIDDYRIELWVYRCGIECRTKTWAMLRLRAYRMMRLNLWRAVWALVCAAAASICTTAARAQGLTHNAAPVGLAATDSTTGTAEEVTVGTAGNIAADTAYRAWSGPFESTLDRGLAVIPARRCAFGRIMSRSAFAGLGPADFAGSAVIADCPCHIFRAMASGSPVVAASARADDGNDGYVAGVLHWLHQTADRIAMLPLVSATRADRMPVLNFNVSVRGEAFRSIGLKKYWKF